MSGRTEEIVRIAVGLGHIVRLHERKPPSEHPDGFTKWWVTCDCGWNSRMSRSLAAARTSGGHHLAKMAGLERSADRKNGLENFPARLPKNVGPTG
jgi:hypothetical protein